MTTTDYILGVNRFGWPPFRNRLWQRNYYDHVIRNAHTLDRIRTSIDDNPSTWPTDPNHPDNHP